MRHSRVAEWKRVRLLTGSSLVRSQSLELHTSRAKAAKRIPNPQDGVRFLSGVRLLRSSGESARLKSGKVRFDSGGRHRGRKSATRGPVADELSFASLAVAVFEGTHASLPS